MKKNTIYTLLLTLFVSTSSFSQTKTICGNVKAFQEFNVIGAEVFTKKSKQQTRTDSLGNYCIECDLKDRLTIKANGFYPKTFYVKEYDSINVNLVLKSGKSNLEKASEGGYMKLSDLAFAVEHFSDMNNDFSDYDDIYDLLQGKYAGVDVNGKNIVIRGVSSFSTDNNPLFVVDEIIVDNIDHVHPRDIASIKILKGASAAIYGSRGGNGVIVITTRTKME